MSTKTVTTEQLICDRCGESEAFNLAVAADPYHKGPRRYILTDDNPGSPCYRGGRCVDLCAECRRVVEDVFKGGSAPSVACQGTGTVQR